MQTIIDITERDLPVCRTCLTPIRGISFRLQEQSGFGDGLMFTHILRYIVPELYLGLSHGPEICYDCKESLRIAYSFRKRCLETETYIGDYLKNMRCTAQVVELPLVIDFIKKLKEKQDNQNIIQQNEGSIEKFSESSFIDGNSKPGSDSENILAQSQLSSDPNLTSIISSSASSQIIRKIRIPKLSKPIESHTNESQKDILKRGAATKKAEPSKIFDSPSSTIRCHKQTSTNKDIKTTKQIEPSACLERGLEVLKVCPKTGLFQNKAGKYLNLQGEEIPDHLIQNIKTDTNNEETNKSFSHYQISYNQQDREGETQGFSIKKINTILENILNKKEDIETEKESLKMCNQTSTDTSTNIVPENSMNICEETGLLRDQNGHYFDFSGNPLEQEQVEAEKRKAKIRGENLFKISDTYTITDEDFQNKDSLKSGPSDFEDKIDMYQISKQEITKNNTVKPENLKKKVDNTAPTLSADLDLTSKKQTYKHVPAVLSKSVINILNFQADENLRIPQQWNPNPEVPKNSNANNLPVWNVKKGVQESNKVLNKFSKTYVKTSFSRSTNKVSESVIKPNLMSVGTVRIKQEPLEGSVTNINNDPSGDSEDTLSAPDLSNENTESSLQNVIDSLDSSDINQYIDVPDFVQIQNFSLNDILKLKAQKKSQGLNEPIKINKPEALTTPRTKVVNQKYTLPDQFMYRGKLLVKTMDGYKFDESNAVNLQGFNKQKNDKTRVGETDGMKRSKSKVAPVREDPKKSTEYPLNTQQDEHICVLFTSYTYDGFYVNDHDYLISPYVKNNMLIKEQKKKCCMCYICGMKHLLKDHVEHMNSHQSKCPSCSINLGTPYMLNLHMRNHSKPCKYCTETIPYPLIKKHLSIHIKEEQEFIEDIPKQRNRRKRKRIKEEIIDDDDDDYDYDYDEDALDCSFTLRTRSSRKRETRSSGKLKKNPFTQSEYSLRKSKRIKNKIEEVAHLPSNPYVLLERLSDEFIKQFNVQIILDEGTKNKVNSVGSSNVKLADTNLNQSKINHNKPDFAVTIKKEHNTDEETDNTINDETKVSKSRNVTAVVEKSNPRRRKYTKRIKLETTIVEDTSPGTRVLRSSFRKKPPAIQLSECKNDSLDLEGSLNETNSCGQTIVNQNYPEKQKEITIQPPAEDKSINTASEVNSTHQLTPEDDKLTDKTVPGSLAVKETSSDIKSLD